MSKNNLVIEHDKLAITMSRIFNAPRERVWQACTDPELVPKWWGLRNTTTVVDKMEVKVGGVWRYIERDGEGNEYAFNGVYKEVQAPERLVYTFEFEPMAGHITTDTLIFEELGNSQTKLTAQTTFESLEDLEGMLQSGMEDGATQSWDQLEELVAKAAKDNEGRPKGFSMKKAFASAGPNELENTENPAGEIAGFWRGLWHGLIAPIAFVISFFKEDVGLYEAHNNGGWYNFGFILGLMITLGGNKGGGKPAARKEKESNGP